MTPKTRMTGQRTLEASRRMPERMLAHHLDPGPTQQHLHQAQVRSLSVYYTL